MAKALLLGEASSLLLPSLDLVGVCGFFCSENKDEFIFQKLFWDGFGMVELEGFFLLVSAPSCSGVGVLDAGS